MPKRLCPFDTYFAPQLKNFIGEKEMTVKSSDGKSALSEIHSKTLQKLYDGAKSAKQQAPCTCGHLAAAAANHSKALDISTNQNTALSTSTNQNTTHMLTLANQQQTEEHRYKQLMLGNHGELIRSAAEIKEMVQQCVESCSFCEAAMPCQQCQRVCQQCGAVFCHNCCLNVFTGTEDTSLCLSCVR